MIRQKRRKQQRGFSLVEVLIALVIMSVGMLGIAGLYVTGMQAGRTSMLRHQAVNLAGDVADRIRANPRAAGAYALAPPAVPASCGAGGVECTIAEMAGFDIDTWTTQASDTLPTGVVGVAFAAAVPGVPPTYTITISWTEPNPLGGVQPSYVITIPVLPI